MKVGDRVRFGRGQGERTLGKIIKMNQETVKIEQLEERGTQKSYPVGTIWKVPYSMVEPADETEAPAGFNSGTRRPSVPNLANEPLEAHVFMDPIDEHILLAISAVYANLSPENLTQDGEAPRHYVEQRRKKLLKQLDLLQKAYGRPVDELAVYDWQQKMEELHKAHGGALR